MFFPRYRLYFGVNPASLSKKANALHGRNRSRTKAGVFFHENALPVQRAVPSSCINVMKTAGQHSGIVP